MPIIQIRYNLRGSGEYFVETPYFSLAYERMYEQFLEDNSLIVHADFSFLGFEIIDARQLNCGIPKRPRYKVTTAEQKAKADAGEMIEPPPENPVRLADTGLFVFDYKPEDEQK